MPPYINPNFKAFKARIEARRKRGIIPHLELPAKASTQVPVSASLRNWCPIAYNQGQCGSCVSNTACGFVKMTQGPSANPARLYLYTKSIMLEHPGQPITDTGSEATDAFEIMSTTGICDESYMPYVLDANQNVIGFGQPPSQSANADAKNHIYPGAVNVTNNGDLLSTVRYCISQGFPVPMEMIVYPSMMTQTVLQNGQVPVPSASELAGAPVGGHAVLLVEYDAKTVTFLNSWGPSVGQSGYFTLQNAHFSAEGADGPVIMELLRGAQVPNFSPSPSPSPPQPPQPTPNPPQPSPQPTPSPSPPTPNPPNPSPNNSPNIVDMMNQMSQAIQTLCTVQNQLVSFIPQLRDQQK